MLWLVLNYYGISFRGMIVGAVLILVMLNLLYWPYVDLKLTRNYPDDFIWTSKWPILKKRNNVPDWAKRKHRRYMLIWHVTVLVPVGLFMIFAVLAKHFHWL